MDAPAKKKSFKRLELNVYTPIETHSLTNEKTRFCLEEVRVKGTRSIPQFHGAEGASTSGTLGGTAKFAQVGQKTLSD